MSYRQDKRQYDDHQDRRERDYMSQRRDRFSENTWNNDLNVQNYNRDSNNETVKNTSAGTMIFVQQRDLGKIIGRGGSQIKALEEETNTKINVSNKE